MHSFNGSNSMANESEDSALTSSSVRAFGRPNDWVGPGTASSKKTTRSWSTKGTQDSVISDANESEDSALGSSSSSLRGFGRPDDWLGLSTASRTKSWRAKGTKDSALLSSSSVRGFGRPDDWVGKKPRKSWRARGTKDSTIARNEATPASNNDDFYQDSFRSAPTVMFRDVKQDDDDDDDNDEFGEESIHEEDFGKIGDDEQDIPMHLLESSMSSLKFNDSIGDFVIETTKNKKYGSSMDSSMHSLLTEDDSKSRFSEAMEMWNSVSSINPNTAKTASFLTSAPSNSSARSIVMDTAKGREIRCTSSHMNSTIAASYSRESISEFEESFFTAIEDCPNAETGSKIKNENKKELYNRTFKGEMSSWKEGSCRPKDTLHLQSELPPRNRNINATVATKPNSHSAARDCNRSDSWIGGSARSLLKPTK